MIVLIPAFDIGPSERGILAAADLERRLKTRVWQMPMLGWRAIFSTRGMAGRRGNCGERSQQQHETGGTTLRGVSSGANCPSERFPCQPASSSDRVSSYRGRMSKHR